MRRCGTSKRRRVTWMPAAISRPRALWPSLKQVIDDYRNGTRYGIHMDADGLIVANAPGVQLTWMDAKVGDWVVTPRAGKPVEIGALWYNALERMSSLAACIEEPDRFAPIADRVRAGFDRFWNVAATCCFDVIDGPGGNDASLRPNQIFAVSLPHSPLSSERQRAVVEKCAGELLTSAGFARWLRAIRASSRTTAARRTTATLRTIRERCGRGCSGRSHSPTLASSPTARRLVRF